VIDHRIAIGAVFALSVLTDGGTTGAASPRLPATLYPSGTQLIYQAHVSNAEMDFDWGFICDCRQESTHGTHPRARSSFHLRSQDQLQRTNGWSQAGNSSQGDRLTQFILYSSQYVAGSDGTGTAWSQIAMHDLRLAVRFHGYRPLMSRVRGLPFASNGEVLAMYRRYGNVSVLLLGYQHGNQEVEGMVSSTAGLAELKHLWRDLVRQVQIA
jgi:hypothetical protein